MKSLFLVGCSKDKKEERCKAKLLYDSERFKKAKNIAEIYSDRWLIVSGKHVVVEPDEVIRPYDDDLNKKSKKEKDIWHRELANKVKEITSKGDVLVCIGDKNYFTRLGDLIDKKVRVYNVFDHIHENKRIEWLNELNLGEKRSQILNEVYDLVYYLAEESGEVMRFSECTGYMDWPSRGIYIFFNSDIPRIVDPETPKVVRVGTHGVSEGSSSTLWQRLKTHKGTKDGGGNHRGSVFRKHVGEALLNKSTSLTCDTWGEGKSASSEIRQKEMAVEKEVSKYIRELELVCIDVDDIPSKHSDRAYLEQNIISLVSGGVGPIDIAHERWLGFSSPHVSIRRSSLWNVDHTESLFDKNFLEVLKKYCYYTYDNKKKPEGSIAPSGWLRRYKRMYKQKEITFE